MYLLVVSTIPLCYALAKTTFAGVLDPVWPVLILFWPPVPDDDDYFPDYNS